MSPIIGSFTGSISFNRAARVGETIVATGGTISEWNGYKIHTFTTTGANTFSISSAPPGSTIDFIVVGGGGPGGNGGKGAGGGGFGEDGTPGTPGPNGYNPAPSPFPIAGGPAGANTGGGGGGGAWSGPYNGTRTGAPGIVVIRYPSTV